MREAQFTRAAERAQRERQEVQQQLAEIEQLFIGAPTQPELLEELRRVAKNGSPAEARQLLATVQRVLAPLQ
ncbi:hypothetical protein AN993_21170 [Stenotrophomonas maltophilia]|uniref:hypothetical protein n=1 Tax=Stenotrophomonas TaxID=40323 RepID=UPI0006BA1A5B|nr:hypothetical protein AN993_21170 [Stenotrophomonas maltophilia]MBA0242730.1 hypothetical protein [Stenotrophomonas maltophilia]MBA0247308.1 hypothetical protein [Stenotrophomonas maltophilia]MBA0306275.1 hypothetical protein [Stenotrophomonas maltophilia]MBA0438887.1 hypothetical protein [Stenotrophomonas maltophilia]